jgi:hypothetical protein
MTEGEEVVGKTMVPLVIDLAAADDEENKKVLRPHLSIYEGDERLWWMYTFVGQTSNRVMLFDPQSVPVPRDIHRRVRKYPDIGRVFSAQFDRTSTAQEDAFAKDSGIVGSWCFYPRKLSLSGTNVDPARIVRVCQHFVVREG